MKKIIFSLIILISIFALGQDIEHALDAYFWSWFFWLQFPLGALSILFLHDLTGGNWGDSSRRYLMAMVSSLWPLIILFIPFLFFTHKLWHSSPLHSQLFFSLRALGYFVLLMILVKLTLISKKSPYLSAWGLFLYILIASLFSTDWAMSRDSQWYSTAYALIWIFSMAIAAFGLMLIFKNSNQRSISETNADQGSIFLIFIISWAYLSFMQYLIIWSANLPKEIIWYTKRIDQGWQFLILPIAMGSIVIPFFLLLNHKLKLDSKWLAKIAGMVLFFRIFDIAWVLLPAERSQLRFYIWDILSFVGIGGLWLTILSQQIKNKFKEQLT